MKDKKSSAHSFRRRVVITAVVVTAAFLAAGVWFFFSLSSPVFKDSPVDARRTQREFDRFTDEIFLDEVTSDTITLNFMVRDRKAYGVDGMETTLGTYSLEAMQNGVRLSKERLETLEEFNRQDLTQEQQLTYDILEILFNQNLEAQDFLAYAECLSPTTGIQAQLPIYFAEYNFYEESDIEEYLALLEMVPDYFADIIRFEQEKKEEGLFMTDDAAKEIIDGCSAFIQNPEENYLITVFAQKLKEVDFDLSDEEKSSLTDRNRQAVLNFVIPAYRDLIDALTEMTGDNGEGGLCRLEKGKEYYAYLVREKSGSDRSLSEIEKLLDSRIKELQKQMGQIIAQSPEALDEAEAREFAYSDPKAALAHLKEAIEEDFPALSSDITCQLKAVDPSLADTLSSAFYLTPAIDDYRDNVIYVNQSERYDLSKVFPTIGHEAYPGHLYQICTFYGSDPAPIRTVISVGGYTEGWGTYAELYSYDLAGFSSCAAELLKDNTLTLLCLYAKADFCVNYTGWDEDALADYLADFGFSAENSHSVYDFVAAEPAEYMEYTLGYLEIEALRDTAQKKLGKNFDLKSFHEFFLSIGPAPFCVIEDRLDDWIRLEKQKE